VRPGVLEHGYGVGAKMLFRLIRLVSGRPLPDAARITFYRPDFYGSHMKKFTQQAMRGRSTWSVGDRELMAAYVSKVNDCPFCVGAHTATASRAYQDEERVAAALTDLDSAPLADGLRATLAMLGTLTSEGTLSAETSEPCSPPVSHPSKSRMPSPSVSRLTRPTVSPTPSPSTCSTATDSRRARNTSSSAATNSRPNERLKAPD